jgi:hypothetical protein
MSSSSFPTAANRPVMNADAFRAVMARPAVAREFFLPVDRAWWDGDRYTLGRWIAKAPRPRLTGVRLQEPRSGAAGSFPERDTQNDLCALVRSVAELRKVPELSGVVLSPEALVGRQQGTIPGQRLVLGLACPADGSYKGEAAAAAQCHRVLRGAIVRAGFAIEYPHAPPDAAAGFPGLLQWAGTVRLRRRADRRWLLLLLLPVVLAPLLFLGRTRAPSSSAGVAAPGDNRAKLLDRAGPAVGPPGPSDPRMASLDKTGKPTVPTVPPGRPAEDLFKSLDKAGKQPGPHGPTDDLIKSFNNPGALEKMLKESGLPPEFSKLGTGGLPAGRGGGSMSYLGIALAAVGTVIATIGSIWFVVAAYEAGFWWVLGILLLPGCAFVYAVKHWSKAWKPLLVSTLGFALLIAGAYFWITHSLLPSLDGLLGAAG